jgi:hypothetical protein
MIIIHVASLDNKILTFSFKNVITIYGKIFFMWN